MKNWRSRFALRPQSEFKLYIRSAQRSGLARRGTLLTIAISAAFAAPAHANCSTGTAVLCTSTGGVQTTTVGTGLGSPITSLTVQSGATISTTSVSISIDHGTIDVAGTVTNNSSPYNSGSYFTGGNTIQFNGNTTLTIASGGVVAATGTDGTGEAINPNNGGNTIINHGTISTQNASDIWFQNADTNPNIIQNYGTIIAGSTGTGTVVGNTSNVVVNFTNETGGVVNGNLNLGGGSDSVSLLGGSAYNGNINTGSGNDTVTIANGASYTGNIDGGTGSNTLVLTGDSGTSTLNSGVSNFNTLDKTGLGTWMISNSLSQLGGNSVMLNVGQGLLVVSGDNTGFSGTTTIQTGGALQIGNGGTTGNLPGNIADDGALAIDRSDTYALSGAISGTGALQQNGIGTTVLSGANTYSGATTVSAGTLQAAAADVLSAASAHTVTVGATLDLAGHDQTVASLNNAGTVSLVGTSAGTTLHVTGNYVGNGGTIMVSTALGDSSSATDKLAVGGNVSGTTTLKVINLGGLGAQTTGSGIEVAAVTGTSTTNAFALSGAHVDAGAYQYYLYKGDARGVGSNWYLRSTLPGATTAAPTNTIAYRPEAALYMALPALLRQSDLAMLGNFHQREGDPDTSASTEDHRQAWGRVIANDLNIDQNGSVAPSSSLHLTGLQLGTDIWRFGNWRTGVYAGYLHGQAKVMGNAGGEIGFVGDNSFNSAYLGTYGTWIAADGSYLDMVLQGARHNTDLNAADNGAGSTQGRDLTASVEVGKPIPIGAGTWEIEPQAQVVHQWLHVDASAISGSTTVTMPESSAWLMRVGLRLKGAFETRSGFLQPYVRVNLYRSPSGTDKSVFSTESASTPVSSGAAYSTAGLAAGATLTLTNRIRLYCEIGRLWADSGVATAVRSSTQNSLGVRAFW